MPDRLRRALSRTEIYLAGLIALMCLAWTLLAPSFFTLQNGVDLIENYSVTAILAVGLFVVLVSGGIDISFAAIASVTQYLAALLATRYDWAALPCILCGLTIGMALGCINGALIHYLQITSIIVTIATMSVFFALLMYFSGGKSIYTLPDWWATRVVFFEAETEGGLTRITLPVVVMGAVVAMTWVLMGKLSAGRQLYALGGNPEAARRLGINVAVMHVLAYGYLGLLAAVAGLVQAHRVGESVPNAMVGSELNVLAAAVLGGASLSGGIGTVPGVLLGILLLAVLQNGLNLLGVSPYFFQIVTGLVILVSTSTTALSGRPRRRAARETLEVEASHG
jgi:simple sugar transport system permease protein